MKDSTKKTLTNVVNFLILVLNGVLAMLNQSDLVATLFNSGVSIC